MISLNLLAKPLDRFASRSPKRALARAERLSKAAPSRALALFAAAAEAGDTEAAFIVGERYLEGKGTLHHPASAVQWYQRAAEAGHLRAQCRLAALHLFGVPQACAVGPNTRLFEPVELGPPIITRPWFGHGAQPRQARRMPRLCWPSFSPQDRKICAILMRRSSGTASPLNRTARKAGLATLSR